MRIAVASANPVKVRSVELGLAVLGDVTVISRPTESGVPDQPRGDAQTRQGAVNRAISAYSDDVDLSVGIEGGVDHDASGFVTFAWIVIYDGERIAGSSRTASFVLPKAVETLVDEGVELGYAMDAIFSSTNSKQGEGAAGLLTNGAISRTDLYVPAITFAAIPLLNPEHEF